MRRTQKVVGLLLFAVLILATIVFLLKGHNFAVLNSAGVIGEKERSLMIQASLLSLIVVIPVFAMLFGFAWRYRENNPKAQKYTPDNGGNRLLETIWWVVPSILLVILSVMIWRSSHELDPYRPLSSSAQPVKVQVVAMQWKWLFIYPEENVASVNLLPLPVDRPVNFQITSDAPMNSFWIPQLGGQVYAMTGMSTKLHLMADRTGSYRGLSANISGSGFAGMSFQAKVTSEADYQKWLTEARKSQNRLDMSAYTKLAVPGVMTESTLPSYQLTKHDLYDTIIAKYMEPGMDMSHMEGMAE